MRKLSRIARLPYHVVRSTYSVLRFIGTILYKLFCVLYVAGIIALAEIALAIMWIYDFARGKKRTRRIRAVTGMPRTLSGRIDL